MINKETAQKQINRLTALFEDKSLLPEAHNLREVVIASLQPLGEGLSAGHRLALFGFMGSLIDDLAGADKEVILAAYTKASLARGEDMAPIIVEAAASGLDLTTKALFNVIDPEPTKKRIRAQFGVHLEEVAEMFDACKSGDDGLNAKMQLVKTLLEEIGAEFKKGEVEFIMTDSKAFGDSLLDQRVTGAGVAHLNLIPMEENDARVSLANLTKLVDGKPVWKEGGKLDKGPYFVAPETKVCQI